VEKLGAMNDGFTARVAGALDEHTLLPSVGLGQDGCWRLEGASLLATTAAAGAARILERV
jgi:hypothetical protein